MNRLDINYPIIVGMNPTKAQLRKGCAWFRLMDWTEEIGISRFSFTNLSFDPHWDKKNVDYEFLSKCLEGHGKIVALGGMVSNHLKKLGVSHHALPHPSPLNRQINNPAYISQRLQECKEYLHENIDNRSCRIYRISYG